MKWFKTNVAGVGFGGFCWFVCLLVVFFFLTEEVIVTVRLLATSSFQHPLPVLVLNLLPTSGFFQNAKNGIVSAL